MNHKFTVNQHVVYPVHGVGQIIDIEQHEYDKQVIQFLVIKFEEDKLTLRLPIESTEKSGLRALLNREALNEIEDILKRRVRTRRMMWSRRAQEYETKINSGDPVAIAEVVRELYKKNDFDQSYSERQIYQTALSRLAKEFAIVDAIPDEEAIRYLKDVLDAA